MRYHAKLPISMPSLCAPEKIDEVKEYTKLQRFARKPTGHKVAFRSLHHQFRAGRSGTVRRTHDCGNTEAQHRHCNRCDA